MKKDGVCKEEFVGMLGACPDDAPATVDCFGRVLNVQVDNAQIFKDDLTGQLLDPTLVKAARKKELEYFDGKDVWELRPISECRRLTGKAPVTVRWVDVNKGDELVPEVRSRLCAGETRFRTSMDLHCAAETFSATPPYEALRCLLYTSPSPRD